MQPHSNISSSAQIHPTAIIEPGVDIGDNTIVKEYTVIRAGSVIGDDCTIGPYAVIGEDPQIKDFKAESAGVRIGNKNVIREFCTIHRSSTFESPTIIGDDNFMMTYSHLGHDCKVGNHVTIANSVNLGGHVEIGDYTVIGGASQVHQNCKLGRFVMMAGASATNLDLVPFCTYIGVPTAAVSTNRFGMKRAGLGQEARSEIMRAFKIIYSDSTMPVILDKLENELKQLPEIIEIVDFIKSSKRGIIRNLGIRSNQA